MSELFKVDMTQRFNRSIHIEHDFDNTNALNDYVPISSPISTLRDTLAQFSDGCRSITWTGPYGGGKSALALLLAAALPFQRG